MEYVRIESIEDPLFAKMHALMGTIFPPEEVLEFSLWEEPLKDQGLRVYVAVHEGEVVGATEYRYYPDMRVAMTDFTIIGREGLGIGPFLVKHRAADLASWVARTEGPMLGMFAEIYNPYAVEDLGFGGVKPMNPYVRREVLSHLGYRRLDMDYVHPSWQGDGEAVGGLNLGFLAADESTESVPGALVGRFLRTYYDILNPKPAAWTAMVEAVERRDRVGLLPL
ncbi:GNAT family N-acetyltransferase [Paenibacillus antri]|uniref:GNAT family N-acetyltransferase n=1 Tax=Paenibacillus antri TaxID=2582848 RepID=A0A5R9G8R0_9BACL|nr:GNAT family N-acetyltransferase [Paenibacillus antri]TLS49454.1 GNAT family N-acetyltransferase [Paenibacillus antri]